MHDIYASKYQGAAGNKTGILARLPVRMSLLAAVLTVFIVPLALAEEPPLVVPAPNDSASLIDAFETMCDNERPSFDHIMARAQAAGMRLEFNHTKPMPNGVIFRNVGWNKQFGLIIGEASWPEGSATSCAVTGGVPDVDDFHAQVVERLKLQANAEPGIVPHMMRTYRWANYHDMGQTIVLQDLSPKGLDGVMLQIIDVRTAPGVAPVLPPIERPAQEP